MKAWVDVQRPSYKLMWGKVWSVSWSPHNRLSPREWTGVTVLTVLTIISKCLITVKTVCLFTYAHCVLVGSCFMNQLQWTQSLEIHWGWVASYLNPPPLPSRWHNCRGMHLFTDGLPAVEASTKESWNDQRGSHVWTAAILQQWHLLGSQGSWQPETESTGGVNNTLLLDVKLQVSEIVQFLLWIINEMMLLMYY